MAATVVTGGSAEVTLRSALNKGDIRVIDKELCPTNSQTARNGALHAEMPSIPAAWNRAAHFMCAEQCRPTGREVASTSANDKRLKTVVNHESTTGSRIPVRQKADAFGASSATP